MPPCDLTLFLIKELVDLRKNSLGPAVVDVDDDELDLLFKLLKATNSSIALLVPQIFVPSSALSFYSRRVPVGVLF